MALAPSIFLDLASQQNLQFLLDTSQDNLDAQSIWRTWLDLAPPQYSLDFETVIGRDRISAAASIVDEDSEAPIRSRNTLEIYRGTMPSMKEKFKLTQKEMRQLKVLQNMPIIGGSDRLLAFLNKDLQEVAVSADKRIDLMMLNAMSNLSVDLSVTNNPDGAVFGTVDLLAQSYQKQGVNIVWTDSANAKPLLDIQQFVQFQYQTRGRQFGQIVMSYDLWLVFIQCTSVMTALQAYFNTKVASNTYALTEENVNLYLQANKLPIIQVISHVTMVEKDGKPTFVKGFNANNVMFAPAGKIGELANAVCMEEDTPVEKKSYAKYGITLVSKWSDDDPLTEFTGMEAYAFPSLDVDNIFILTTNVQQTSFV